MEVEGDKSDKIVFTLRVLPSRTHTALILEVSEEVRNKEISLRRPPALASVTKTKRLSIR